MVDGLFFTWFPSLLFFVFGFYCGVGAQTLVHEWLNSDDHEADFEEHNE